MRSESRDAYQSWLLGELLLIGLLGAGLALFVSRSSLLRAWDLPQLRLVLDTAVAVAAALVAVLAGIRFAVEGRRVDLLLCAGFTTGAAGTAAFAIAPVLGGEHLHRAEAWAGLWAQLAAAALIAAAAFVRGRITERIAGGGGAWRCAARSAAAASCSSASCLVPVAESLRRSAARARARGLESVGRRSR